LLRITDKIIPIVKKEGRPTAHYKSWIDQRRSLEVAYADHQYVFPIGFHEKLNVIHRKMATLDRMSHLEVRIDNLYTDDTQQHFSYGEASEHAKEYREELKGFNFTEEYTSIKTSLTEVQGMIIVKFGKFE
jgi:hypothetical protein